MLDSCLCSWSLIRFYRYHIGDYSGQILADLQAIRHKQQPSYFASGNNQTYRGPDKQKYKTDDAPAPKRKREYKRRHKNDTAQQRADQEQEFAFSSDDEPGVGPSQSTSDQDEEDPDGPYAFKRKLGCSYQHALTEQYGNWPWAPPEEGGLGDKRYRFCLTSVSQPKPRCVGFARRRLGRGGR